MLTIRTDGGAARVTGGVYALDAKGEPASEPVSDVTGTFKDDQAVDLAGAAGLSGWQGEIRFDNVFVFACPERGSNPTARRDMDRAPAATRSRMAVMSVGLLVPVIAPDRVLARDNACIERGNL